MRLRSPSINREIVVCGIPFETPQTREALKKVRGAGFTSVQIYSFWRDFEPRVRGQFDWAPLDEKVRLIQEAGLRFVPFLLMGPKYAAPGWWLDDPRHTGLRCLEHGRESPVESIWNPAFRREIRRVLGAFARHYLPWDVIESVQPGICGDYGEAIYPVIGNWPGDYHTHRGYWCGGDEAAASFRSHLRRRYRTVHRLNAAWRSTHGSFDEIRPRLPHTLPSPTARFDLIAWYQSAMTNHAAFWMAECRRAFPGTPAYLCTGGADDDTPAGARFSAQAKAAALQGGGIRLTNEVNAFEENFRLCAHTAAACAFYGAPLGLEPVGPMTEQGVRNRMFGSAAFGNRQVFHYHGNVFDPKSGDAKPAAACVRDHAALIGEARTEAGIALFWPVDQGLLENAIPAEARAALRQIRRNYPVSPVDEEMILDGALGNFRCLVMIGAGSTRRKVLEAVAGWVGTSGGRLLSVGRCLDLEREPVADFDALFGIRPDSEEAWGHHRQEMNAPAGFPRLAGIPRYHSERGWLGLDPAVRAISIAREGPGGGQGAAESTRVHAVTALFRKRHRGAGWAVMYSGPVTFDRDPQACFADSGTLAALLADICAQSGVKPLGTQDDEIARARVGRRLLVLKHDQISVLDSSRTDSIKNAPGLIRPGRRKHTRISPRAQTRGTNNPTKGGSP